MNKNRAVVRAIDEKYENNCLEVNLGRDLVWYKELNEKGEVTENLLMQEVDGGQRGVDIFGKEHFVRCSFDNKTMMLLQSDGGVKRYARDEKGMFYRADENFNIIKLEKAKKYRPVAKNSSEKQKKPLTGRIQTKCQER